MLLKHLLDQGFQHTAVGHARARKVSIVVILGFVRKVMPKFSHAMERGK